MPEGERPHALFGEPEWRGTLVHLYSFSKVFALTGYRVGGITAGAGLMAEIEKAMDCVSICPPRLGQEAALYGLKNLLPWARRNTAGLKARADLLGGGLERSNRWRLVSIGAYFAYVEHPFAGQRSTEVSKRMADEENLLTIPGDIPARGQKRFVRLAFANVADDKIPIVLELGTGSVPAAPARWGSCRRLTLAKASRTKRSWPAPNMSPGMVSRFSSSATAWTPRSSAGRQRDAPHRRSRRRC